MFGLKVRLHTNHINLNENTMKIPLFKLGRNGIKMFTLLTIFLFSSCLGKDDGEPQTAQEILIETLRNVNQDQLQNDLEIIDEEIDLLGLTEDILKEPNGVRYIIHRLGTGNKPSLNSTVRIRYSGKLLSSGEEIDANDDLEIILSALLIGMQTTLPLIPEGSEVTLYIPSGYAYGPNEYRDDDGNVFIPFNSNLIFEVELLEVN